VANRGIFLMLMKKVLLFQKYLNIAQSAENKEKTKTHVAKGYEILRKQGIF